MDFEALRRTHPTLHILEASDPVTLADYLSGRGWLRTGDPLAIVESAGDGNMNRTLRAATESGRSIILKQAFPFVAKYPQIAAPWDRSAVEATFYQTVQACDGACLASRMPDLLWHDPDNHILALSDLGKGGDLTTIYQNHELDFDVVSDLGAWLARLHAVELSGWARRQLRNREMRALNHAHIFEIPFGNNAPSMDAITPDLDAVAADVRATSGLAERVAELGKRYLADDVHGRLLHGDFFPGSHYLSTGGRPYVIDPEFAFPGPVEFDVGVFMAHSEIAGLDKETKEAVVDSYHSCGGTCDPGMVRAFAGVEIIRRLLGVAQLPLSVGLAEKKRLLQLAVNLIMSD